MKPMRPALAGLIAVLIGLLLLSPAGGSADRVETDPIPYLAWQQQVVEPGVAFFYLGMPSLALDPAGRPHIVYGQNGLFHSWFDGAAWRSETLVPPPATIGESVIAINDAGRLIVAYMTGGRVFVLAREAGQAWAAALELPLRLEDNYLSLALDSDGRPHLAAGFSDVGDESLIHIATETAAGWMVESVHTGRIVSGAVRLALDSQDQPVLLYAEVSSNGADDAMWLARRDGGVWRHEPVAEGCIISSKSLALDKQDKAHIVYSEHCDAKLTYAREGDGEWELTPVTDDGVMPSLALDDAGRPAVVYNASQTGQIFAVLTSSGWDTTIVQPGAQAGYHNTLILDDAGAAHIASLKDDLYYATNAGGAWGVAQVAAPVTAGFHNALALDSSGTPYVFYDKAEAGELWWGVNTGGGWTTEFLANVEPLFLDVAADIDTQDRPHVAYIDIAVGGLVVGFREAGDWSLESVDTSGDHLSLAVGSDDSPRLLLIRDTVAIYWYKQAGVWVSEPVGGPNSEVADVWLALDSQDRPHIVYTGTGGSIHAVRQTNGLWAVETLPFAQLHGLALGVADKLYLLHTTVAGEKIAQPTYSDTTLWLAERDGTTWVDTSLDTHTAWWNLEPSLAVDDDGGVHIAYRDGPGKLYYRQRDASGHWLLNSDVGGNAGDVSLLAGADGRPRLLAHNAASLTLGVGETRLLAWHVLLPVTMK